MTPAAPTPTRPTMLPRCSCSMSICRTRLCAPASRDQWQARDCIERGVPLRVVESALLAGISAPTDPARRMVRHCRRFARWPTSSRSSTNCWSIPPPTDISNTCASSSAKWPSEGPIGRSSEKYVF